MPVDGEVVDGSGYVNEAQMTGESIPAKKEVRGFGLPVRVCSDWPKRRHCVLSHTPFPSYPVCLHVGPYYAIKRVLCPKKGVREVGFAVRLHVLGSTATASAHGFSCSAPK